MKNFLLSAVILVFAFAAKAQITYEFTYPGPATLELARPVIINMGRSDDYKIMYLDYKTNQLKLFNLDHTSFATINIPILMVSPSEYTVGYVTWSLFDCDTTMFEYAILPGSWRNTLYIYREDGTVLFQRDSTLAPYTYGIYSGSYEQKPVYNTPSGAKLFLAKADSIGLHRTIDVYALCGKLPTNDKQIGNDKNSFVKVFPNPTNAVVNFEIFAPSNFEEVELLILDGLGNEIRRENIDSNTGKYELTLNGSSNGTYYYVLMTRGIMQESGKFLLIK